MFASMRNGFLGFIAAWLWVGVVALPAAEPKETSGAGPRPTLVVLGDSLAAGYGVEPTEAFPALLQRKLDAAGMAYEVVNAGVSGDTTAGAANAKAARADVVLSLASEGVA